jgi:hypothetical protein
MEGKTTRKLKDPQSPLIRPRLNTARPILKSKTTTEILRPISGKPKEFYTLSRLLPNIVKEDKELLFEENLRLKAQSHELLEENMLLKTRVKQLESKKKKTEKKEPNLTLISALKEKIRESNEKVQEKEEEIKILRRNIKTCKIEECEIQIQEMEEECKRLSNYLAEFMKQKEIPNSHLEYENRLYNKGKVINKLKKDLVAAQDDLALAKEEISALREKIQNLEKKNKKNSPATQELIILREELENFKFENSRISSEFFKREEDLRYEIKVIKESLEKETQRLKIAEKDSEEKQAKISALEKQMSYLKSESYKPQEIMIPKALIPNEEKSKHPPRLFVKIWEVSKSKNMLMSVFLSLLDKNNNGLIEAEELRKGINLHGKLIKRKHVDQVLKLMNMATNTIPLRTLEQLIEKYEYGERYSSSSEEEIVEPIRPRAEKLRFKDVRPDPKMNEFQVPQNYAPPPKFKESEVTLIKPEELSKVFERIRLQMAEKMMQKNRCINMLFGNYLDPEQQVTIQELSEHLQNGGIFLGSNDEILKLSKFLLEPDGVERLKDSDHKSLKGKMSDFSKKFNKYLPSWPILDRFKLHVLTFSIVSKNKSLLLSRNLIKLEEFHEMMKNLGISDVNCLLHLYICSFSLSKEVFQVSVQEMFMEIDGFQRKISDLVAKHKNFLNVLSVNLEKSGKGFEEIFSYDREILTNVESFANALKSMEVPADEEFITDIKFGKYNCHLGLLKSLLQNLS